MASARSLTGAFAILSLFIAPSAHAASSSLGAETYMQSRCFACHGQMGYGGAGPRFRNDRMLAASDYVIGQILLGSQHQTPPAAAGIMPPFAALSNEQIAAVATYIRNSWGNNFGPVSSEDVAEARQKFLHVNNQAQATQSGGSQ